MLIIPFQNFGGRAGVGFLIQNADEIIKIRMFSPLCQWFYYQACVYDQHIVITSSIHSSVFVGMVDGIIVRIVRAVQVSGRSKNQSTKVN